MRLLSAALVAALAGAAPASAAVTWSSPGAIAGSGIGSQPLLAQGPAGPVGVFWNVNLHPRSSTGPFPARASTLGPGLLPQPTRTLHPSFSLVGTPDSGGATYGHDGVVLPDGSSGVALGPVGGPLRTHHLPGEVRAVAGNSAGDVAILSEACATRAPGCHPAAPQLVLYRSGRGFAKPIALDRKGHSYSAGLAIDAAGEVLAAWDRDGRIYARFISPAGKPAPIQPLAVETGPPALVVALSGDGRAAVGWTEDVLYLGLASGSSIINLALAGHDRRFDEPDLLQASVLPAPGQDIPGPGLVLALPDGQPGLAVWSAYDGTVGVVRAASFTPTFGLAQTVSEPGVDTALASAAESSRGEAAILLSPAGPDSSPPTTGPGGLDAVTRATPAQAFGPPTQIVGPPAAIDGADLAIQATTGVAFATWRDVAGPIGWSVSTPIG
jgi:hypothetical protein